MMQFYPSVNGKEKIKRVSVPDMYVEDEFEEQRLGWTSTRDEELSGERGFS